MGITLKILVVQETDWIKKGPHQSHHLFERLSALGHKIRVIDFELDWYKQRGHKGILSKRKILNATPKVLAEGKIIVIKPSFIKIRGLDLISIGFTQFLEILRQIKRFKPDIVVSFGIVCGFSASLICKFYRIPFCEYWIDVLHELIPTSLFKGLGLSLEKNTIKRSDLFVAINERLLEYGKRFKPHKYALVRAGVDLDRFIENKLLRKRKRELLGFKDSDVILFYMGYLYNFSGLVEVIECIKSDPAKYSRFKLVITGEGDQMECLKELTTDLNVNGKVKMIGWQPYEEIPAFIAASDICLLPAYSNRIMNEIVPIKIYEYLALGKPVIATPLPGLIKEFGTDNGVVYSKSPNDVINRCYSLIKKNLGSKMGKRGRKFVEKHCNWDRLIDDFLNELKISIKLKKKIVE